jgi:hypothetical protein
MERLNASDTNDSASSDRIAYLLLDSIELLNF